MRLGVLADLPEPGGADDAALLEAEALGYASIWLKAPAEREAELLLAAARIAVRTRSVGLGVVGRLVGFLHPLRVAEDLAVLDLLSGGRLGWAVPGDAADARLGEALAIVRGAWSGASFAHAGRHYTIPEIVCHPAPARVGGPTIFRSVEAHPRREGDAAFSCYAEQGVNGHDERKERAKPEGPVVPAARARIDAGLLVARVRCTSNDTGVAACADGVWTGSAAHLLAALEADVAARTGDPLVLICAAPGDDPASVAWTRRALAEAAFG